MSQHVVTRTVNGQPIRFVWEEGPYVDVRVAGRAIEVINVWGVSGPRIERTTAALAATVDAWLADGAFARDLEAGNYN